MNLDKDFKNILQPLYHLNAIICTRKFILRNGTIFKLTFKQFSCNFAVYAILIFLMYSTFKFTVFKSLNFKIYYTVIYGQHVGNYIIVSCYSFGLSESYVQLINKLQAINRFEHDLQLSRKLRREFLSLCILLIFVFSNIVVSKLLFDPYWNWARAGFLSLNLIFDYEMVFAIFVVRFLALKIKKWCDIIARFPHREKLSNDCQLDGESDIIHDITETDSRTPEESLECGTENGADSSSIKKLFAVFKKIIDGTCLMKKAFQFIIFFYAISFFTQSVVYMGLLIMWLKTPGVTLQFGWEPMMSHSIGVMLWLLKALVLQAALGYVVETLTSGIKAARAAACLLLSQQCSQATNRYAKNVLRIADTRFNGFCACSALEVDAAMPLRLAAIVAAYTVVLLQFAFL